MTNDPSHLEPAAQRRWIPYAVLALALLLTFSATAYVGKAGREKDWRRFEAEMHQARDRIQSRIDNNVTLLRGGAALFAAGPIDRAEFQAYVERLDLWERHPGIQGIGFSMRVRPEERQALIDSARREGVTVLRPDGRIEPFTVWTNQPVLGEREEHTILYLEPQDRRNHAALGYDMFTEPVRQSAMDRAWRTGKPAATGKVTLVQEIEGPPQPGFLIYVPVYRGRHLPSPPDRKATLEGFVYSPLRVEDLLTGVFSSQPGMQVDFKAYDGSPAVESALLHDSRAVRLRARTEDYTPRFKSEKPLDLVVADRIWRLTFATRPEFEAASERSWVPFLLPVGLVLSGILFFVTRAEARARDRAERIAAELRQSEAEVRQSSAALRRSEEQLRLVTDSLPVLISYIDQGQRYRFNNQSHRQWFKGLAADMHGRTVREVTGDELYEVVRPNLERALAGEEVAFETRLTFPVGERFVSILYIPHRNAEGQVEGIISLVTDVTEQKRLYHEISDARKSAEDASRMKDEFVATLSHELRTPLNAILGWAQLLRMGASDAEELDRGLETIERNARAQAQLVEDLLDMSRIISGKLRLEVGPVHLGEVAAAAMETVRPAAEAKEIRLVQSLDGTSVEVVGDAARLQQVTWNLLSNAIKFTPGGGRVEVALGQEDGQVALAVRDTGAGIHPEFLPHVFDRFRQADGTTTRRHGGLGLGLAIARHLVELHGGTVHAHSDGEGRGSVFTVRLPAARRQATHSSQAPDAAEARQANGASPPPRLRGVRVLVVDDEADARELIRQVLGRCGAEVTTAASVAEALAALDRCRPQVLVSDISMPGEDGYALIRRIRQVPELAALPAVALTAFARTEDRQRALDAGFQVHVPKPVQAAELTAVVIQMVGRAVRAPERSEQCAG